MVLRKLQGMGNEPSVRTRRRKEDDSRNGLGVLPAARGLGTVNGVDSSSSGAVTVSPLPTSLPVFLTVQNGETGGRATSSIPHIAVAHLQSSLHLFWQLDLVLLQLRPKQMGGDGGMRHS